MFATNGCVAQEPQQGFMNDYWGCTDFGDSELGPLEYDTSFGCCFMTRDEALDFSKDQAALTNKRYEVTKDSGMYVVYLLDKPTTSV